MRDWLMGGEFFRMIRQLEERERAMTAMFAGDALRDAIEQMERQEGAVRAMTQQMATMARTESIVQQMVERELMQRDMMEAMAAQLNALRIDETVTRVAEQMRQQQSVVDAVIGLARDLRPLNVHVALWDDALETVQRRLQAFEVSEDWEEVDVVEEAADAQGAISAVWAVVLFLWEWLAKIEFALVLISGGEVSLVKRAGPSAHSPAPLEVLQSGHECIVIRRAVVRVAPDSSADGLGRLNPGDTVHVYDPEGNWVRVVCFETMDSGWVYRRHLRMPGDQNR